jgi:hypothetical protein
VGNSCSTEQAQEGHATEQRRHLAEGDIHWIAAGADLSICWPLTWANEFEEGHTGSTVDDLLGFPASLPGQA